MSSKSNNSNTQSKKRKNQEEIQLDPVSPDTVDSLSVNVSIPLTDDQKITSIVTKRLSLDNVKDVTEAMESLRELVDLNHENRKTAFRRGAPLAVVQVMRRKATSPQIQSMGIQVLTNISCCMLDDFEPDIIAVGGLKCCLEAMERHDSNPNVQGDGCTLIGNLWRLPDVRKTVVDEGGLEAVVTAMEENEENTEVQHCGCFALTNILYKTTSSTWTKAVVDAGCIDLVIDAMNNHPDDAELQYEGCEFLCTLAEANEDYRNKILDAKGLVPVVEAQRIHKNNKQVKQTAQNTYAAISK